MNVMEEIRAKIDSLEKTVSEMRPILAELVVLKNTLPQVGMIQAHLTQQDTDRREDQKNLMLILNGDNVDPVNKPGLLQRISKTEAAIEINKTESKAAIARIEADSKSFAQNVRWFVGIIATILTGVLGDRIIQFLTGKK